MKHLLLLITLSLTLLLTGCEVQSPFSPSKEEIELKNKELDAKIKQAQEELLLKAEQMRKELTVKAEQEQEALSVKKEIELAKLNKDLEKEKLSIQKEEVQAKNHQQDNHYKLSSLQSQHDSEFQKLLLILIAFIILVIAGGLYFYFNNRRKDKLKAYEDNLQKYFHEKENRTRLEIANKVLDTISNGHLSEDQETKLISSITEPINVKSENKSNDNVYELEVIDDKQEKTTRVKTD